MQPLTRVRVLVPLIASCLLLLASPVRAQVSCCLPTGCVNVATVAACTSLGGGQVPDCGVCQLGACCAFQSTSCTLRPSQFCSGGGQTYQGAGTTCSPANFCGGACCDANGMCTFTTPPGCLGTSFGGRGSSCGTTVCPLIRPCCVAAGTCTLSTQANCSGPGQKWDDIDLTCSANLCTTPAACCNRATGQCTSIPLNQCLALGLTPSVPGSTCNATFCPTPTGACCQGPACSLTTAPNCTGGRRYLGDNTTCGVAGRPNPCCPADFNNTQAVSPQDLFDYLAAFFTGCP
jgi:hypothetical protein